MAESLPTKTDDSDLIMSTSMSGNLAFELLISPPRAAAATPTRSSKISQSTAAAATSPVSLEAITSKMKTAEEKRERHLDEKLGKIKEHEKHVSEVRKSREMHSLASGEDSVRKVMMAEELRQKQLGDLVQKLKDHEKHIEQVHKRLAKRNEAETAELEKQLDDASLRRDMVLLAIREKQQKQEGAGPAKAKENITP